MAEVKSKNAVAGVPNGECIYQKFQNEYFFASMIQKVNDQRMRERKKLITVREARALRKQWLDTFAQKPSQKAFYEKSIKGTQWDFCSGSSLCYTGDSRVRRMANQEKSGPISNRVDEMVSSLKEVLPEANITSKDYTDSCFRFYSMKSDNKLYMPISPYDDTFANNSFVVDNPTSIAYVAIDNTTDYNKYQSALAYAASADLSNIYYRSSALFMNATDDDYLPERIDKNEYMSRIRDAYGNEFPDNSVLRNRRRNAGYDSLPVLNEKDGSQEKFYDTATRTGLAAMKPYMTDEDYEKVSDVYLNAHSAHSFKASDYQRSVDFLKKIAESGASYEMTCKRNGELICKLSDSNMSVTIVPQSDSGFDWNFAKIQAYSTSFRFSSTKSAKDSNKHLPYVASADDAYNLLRYAQGHTVEKRNARANRSNIVGVNDMYKDTAKGKHIAVNTAYAPSMSSSNSKGITVEYDSKNEGFIKVSTSSPNRTMFFGADGLTPAEHASNWLQSSIASARDNYSNELNVEDIIKQAEEHMDDVDYQYPYSADEDIANIQKKYWHALTSPAESIDEISLTKVGFDTNNFDEDTKDIQFYEGPIEDQIRQHASDTVNTVIGSWEADETGKRFNPIGVTTYMDATDNQTYNNDTMIVAMDLAKVDASELKGSDYYAGVVKNRLLKFNPDTAIVMKDHDSEFIRRMHQEIYDTIRTSGCEINDEDILIDENGVVQYKAKIYTGRDNQISDPSKLVSKTTDVTGYIGQIFAPEKEHPGVITKFANGDNYMFVPGYTAKILPQKDNENLSLEDRLRLDGYPQHMARAIRSHIREDLISNFANYEGAPKGETTSLNHVYRQLYDVRHPVNYFEITKEEGMDDKLRDAILRTESQRVSYGKAYKEGATLNASYAAVHDLTILQNDLNMNPLTLTGGRNLALMTEEGDGYFDKDATSTGITQGITRYIADGARVNQDGSITPADDKDARTSLFTHEYMKFSDNVPFDRRQMVFNNLLKAQMVTEPVPMAQTTLAGWNFDDGFVVTKEFAEKHPVRGHDGQMRPITVGDKILDFGGNKGVIPLVYDRDMTEEEAEKNGLKSVYDFFKANPTVEVVGAPFAGVGRFNASTYLECSQETDDMINPRTGETIPGAIGHSRFIVTHMTVDEKTHIYDDDEVAKGNGRSASAQLAWGLDSKGSEYVKQSFYGDNDRAFQNMREYMLTVGYDVDEVGKVRNFYAPHEGESREVFALPEPVMRMSKGVELKTVDSKRTKAKFVDIISKQGGFLTLPFSLKYPDGRPLGHVSSKDADGNEDPTRTGYALPVMSSFLRSGQTFEDGTQTTHDYTQRYAKIYEEAAAYINAQRQLENRDELTAKQIESFEQIIKEAPEKAQLQFSSISKDIISHKLEGKHNAFKSEMMSNTLPRSATAVWTADPRLDIDELAMGPDMIKTLGVKEGDHVMVWRDPLLRDAGVRYLRVKASNELTGVAINPVMDKGYDGDFDGDSVAVVALDTQLASQMTSREKERQALHEFDDDYNSRSVAPSITEHELRMAHQRRYNIYSQSVDRNIVKEFNKEWRQFSSDGDFTDEDWTEFEEYRAKLESTDAGRAVIDKYMERAAANAKQRGETDEEYESHKDTDFMAYLSKRKAQKEFYDQEYARLRTEYRKEHKIPKGEKLSKSDIQSIEDDNYRNLRARFESMWMDKHGSQAIKSIYVREYERAKLDNPDVTSEQFNDKFFNEMAIGAKLSDYRREKLTEARSMADSDEGYYGIKRKDLATFEEDRFKGMRKKGLTDDEIAHEERMDIRKHARLAYAEKEWAEHGSDSDVSRQDFIKEACDRWETNHTSEVKLAVSNNFVERQLAENPDMDREQAVSAWRNLSREERDAEFTAYRTSEKEKHMNAYYRQEALDYVSERYVSKAIRQGKTSDEAMAEFEEIVDTPDIQSQINDAIESRDNRNKKLDSKIRRHRNIANEAERLFSVNANLLDYGVKNDDGTFDIMLNHGLDLAMSEHERPELAEKWKTITAQVNAFEKDFEDGKIDYERVSLLREGAVASINDYLKESFEGNACEAAVSYKNDYEHIASMNKMVEAGAKGSPSKIVDYGKFAGIHINLKEVEGEDGKVTKHVDLESLVSNDGNTPLAGRKESIDTQYATAVKASVGVAGKFSQRGMKNCRDACAKAVLEMTYPATQGLLQAKHDPIDAQQKYGLLRTALRDNWKGYKLEPVEAEEIDQYGNLTGNMCRVWQKVPQLDAKGKQVYDQGRPVYKRAKVEEWAAQTTAICTDPSGLNVKINPDYCITIAHAIADKDGYVEGVEVDGKSSLLDRLAYGTTSSRSTLDILKEAADKYDTIEAESLFDGKCCSKFASSSVKMNMKALQDEDKSMKAQTKSDIKQTDMSYSASFGDKDTQTAQLEQESITDKMAKMLNELNKQPDLDDNVEAYIEDAESAEEVTPTDVTPIVEAEPVQKAKPYNPANVGLGTNIIEQAKQEIKNRQQTAVKIAESNAVVQDASAKPKAGTHPYYNPANPPKNNQQMPATLPSDDGDTPGDDSKEP